MAIGDRGIDRDQLLARTRAVRDAAMGGRCDDAAVGSSDRRKTRSAGQPAVDLATPAASLTS
ncbi:MAG TPA: hypothetical protein VLE45_04000, partial [Burkholderiaceae bacterium]|nr:hypothetical protein [Burkholderiaceae bacterium]